MEALRVFAFSRHSGGAKRGARSASEDEGGRARYQPSTPPKKKPPTAWGRTSAGPALGGAGVYRRPACAGGTQAEGRRGIRWLSSSARDTSARAIPTGSHTGGRAVSRELGSWNALPRHTERSRTVHFRSSKHFEGFALAP